MIQNYINDVENMLGEKVDVRYTTTLKKKPFQVGCNMLIHRVLKSQTTGRAWTYWSSIKSTHADHKKATETLKSRITKYFDATKQLRFTIMDEKIESRKYNLVLPQTMEYFELLKKYTDPNIRYILKNPLDGVYSYALIIDVCTRLDDDQFANKFDQIYTFFNKTAKQDTHKFSTNAVNSFMSGRPQQSFTLHLADPDDIPMLTPFLNGPFKLRRTEHYIGEY